MTLFFLQWRLNVDAEFQGWILLFASMCAINVFCLPCQWAGGGWTCTRTFANRVQRHLPIYLICAGIFNAGFMFLIVTWMPDWEPKDYIACLAKSAAFLAKHAVKMMLSIAIIAAAVVVVACKDRIMKIVGIDDKTLFRFKLRDVFGAGNLRAIEIEILRVEDLQNKNMFAANNVFVEANLGYNEPMKTRVHNNAGTACSIKETLQLNFDEDEEEELLKIVVKNQKVMGADEIGRLKEELTAEKVLEIEKECSGKRSNDQWAPGSFVMRELMPSGKIWIRIQPVEDEDHRAMMC